MPQLAPPQELINRPTIGIYRIVNGPDEAISPTYTVGLNAAFKQILKSAFWQSKAHFAEARMQLDRTRYLTLGWDADDAAPPNEVARALAARILNILEHASLPPTRLTPSVEGGIAVSFVEGTNRAVIETYNTGEIAAATYSEEGEPAVWEPGTDEALLRAAAEQIRVHLAS